MPEDNEGYQAVTAADVLSDIEDATGDATQLEKPAGEAVDPDEDVLEDEDQTAVDPDDEDEDGEDDADLDDDDDDDEFEYKLPDLIPEIEASPEALKRVKDYERGINKIVERAKAKEAELTELIPRVQAMSEWGQAFESPETAIEAYRELGQRLSQVHGLDLGAAEASTSKYEADDYGDDWEAAGFDSPGEYRAYVKAKAEMEAMIKPYQAELEKLKTERERAEQERQFRERVDKLAPKAIKALAVEDNGWKVTREMVAEAIQNLPQFADDPVKAVRMWHSDNRAKYMARKASEGSQRRTDMVKGKSAAQGHKMPDPGHVKAADILRILRDP
jgi:DNA repair exonuclease SbcCD ATPase subunit